MKFKLTAKMLEEMKPYTQFASGVTIDNPSGANMMNSNRPLLWVACRGQIHDWAIYIYYNDEGWSIQKVHDEGDKVISKENIKNLIDCDDEAFKLYRY